MIPIAEIYYMMVVFIGETPILLIEDKYAVTTFFQGIEKSFCSKFIALC